MNAGPCNRFCFGSSARLDQRRKVVLSHARHGQQYWSNHGKHNEMIRLLVVFFLPSSHIVSERGENDVNRKKYIFILHQSFSCFLFVSGRRGTRNGAHPFRPNAGMSSPNKVLLAMHESFVRESSTWDLEMIWLERGDWVILSNLDALGAVGNGNARS